MQLKNLLTENDPVHAEVLNTIKRRFRDETFTREVILQVILRWPELVSILGALANVRRAHIDLDSYAVRQLRDGALPEHVCRPGGELDVRLHLANVGTGLTTRAGRRFRTSACRPRSLSMTRTYTTIFVVRYTTSRSSRFSRAF